MKRMILMGLAGLALAMSGALAGPESDQAGAAFDRLRTLVGDWESKAPDGSPITLTYRLVAGGHTLMEENSYGSMVTMYHRDGAGLMLTHYCAGDNQPRMRAKGLTPDGAGIDFQFADVTNLSGPDGAYMGSMKVTFVDNDHITQEWVHVSGSRKEPLVITWARKK